jgi:hypothetical protein
MLPHWSLPPICTALVERQEVVRLEHLVAELRERDAASEAGADRLPGNHGADAEVLADVAQEGDQFQARQPLVVVDQDSGMWPSVEIEEGAHLLFQSPRPHRDLLSRVQRALARLAGRITDESGAPPHQHDGPMPGQLDPAESQERHQTAHVQAVGGGVEAHVDRARRLGQMRGELVGRRDVGHESAPVEILEHWRWHRRQALSGLHYRTPHSPAGRPRRYNEPAWLRRSARRPTGVALFGVPGAGSVPC